MSTKLRKDKDLERLWPDLERGDEKAVHEVRKLSRKVGARLKVAGAPKSVRHAWRDLRRAIAPVRDRDAVLPHLVEGLESLGAAPEEIAAFRGEWLAERERQFRGVTLPDPPPDAKLDVNLEKRARKRLEGDLDRVREDAVRVLISDDSETWHAWRKDLKALRHTLELAGEVPPALTDLLSALGRLQDSEVTRALLAERTWTSLDASLRAREEEAAENAKRAAREAWANLDSELGQVPGVRPGK